MTASFLAHSFPLLLRIALVDSCGVLEALRHVFAIELPQNVDNSRWLRNVPSDYILETVTKRNVYTRKPQCRDRKNTNACARKPDCLRTRCGRGPVPTHARFGNSSAQALGRGLELALMFTLSF